MGKTISIWELLTTPICLRSSPQIDEAEKAKELLHRHAVLSGKSKAACARLQREVEEAVRKADSVQLSRSSKRLLRETRRLELLQELASYTAREINSFRFSSWMLKDSFQYCTQRPEEGMHFVLGMEEDGVGTGTAMVPFEYAHRSVVGAAGEHRATHKICIEAHESGHRILALLHSHPGSGIHANHHSSTDEATQRLWERTTRMIGGIWSRDGYLRWYSSSLSFEVEIQGNHLRRINDHVWKLDEEYVAQAMSLAS